MPFINLQQLIKKKSKHDTSTVAKHVSFTILRHTDNFQHIASLHIFTLMTSTINTHQMCAHLVACSFRGFGQTCTHTCTRASGIQTETCAKKKKIKKNCLTDSKAFMLLGAPRFNHRVCPLFAAFLRASA